MSASTLIMGKPVTKLGSDLRKQTYSFLEKLTENDANASLHIEPIANCRDARVRTGRVTQQYRAVLFRLDGPTQPAYVFVGVWNHDDAIKRAQKSELSVNPVNGVSEIRLVEIDGPTQPAASEAPLAATPEKIAPSPDLIPVSILGLAPSDLINIGIDTELAHRASLATTEDQILELAEAAVEWQGLALVDLVAGVSLAEVTAKLGLVAEDQSADPEESTDTKTLRGFDHPAAKISYTWIEDNSELQRVIDGGDYAAWRVFLHPEQRRYATQSYRGTFRLSGGAGTGKTVVLIHRAAELAGRSSQARLFLTTFTKNLAAELTANLQLLAPDIEQPSTLDVPGVYVDGVDALVSAVIKRAGSGIAPARAVILGSDTGGLTRRTEVNSAWREAIDAGGNELPAALRSVAFLDAEYGEVVLPHRLTDLAGYLRVRRPGRGVRLNRGERTAVWRVIESYRLSARAAGSVDFREAAAIAAAYVDLAAENGQGRLFDHVLVDEGQDLAPTHWQLIRSLVEPGPDDVFIAEDSHQRIYGRRITLKPYGLNIVGRSRRLSLNYRTTAQNLRYALRVLEPGTYTDLEDEPELAAYRSARGGPEVRLSPAAGISEELDQAARQIRDWLTEAAAEEQPPETIAILVRDRNHRDRVVTGLAERGVTVRAVDREAVPPGAPVVMTMHRAKGTEFRDVLLFGVGAATVPRGLAEYEYAAEEAADALLRERSLLYVAATRARDQLAVSWSRESSPLLPAS